MKEKSIEVNKNKIVVEIFRKFKNRIKDKTVLVPATPENIKRAASLLREGELVAFPTETVYGLGADATNSKAVASIFAAKGRPTFNPLIVHVKNFEAAAALGEFSPKAHKIASLFWPGPLTLVVPLRASSKISELTTAGLQTIAIRVPNHPVAQFLLKESDCPIAAPSANKSGHVSPTCAGHVFEDLKDEVSMILDGGSVQHGLESTVINASGETLEILRAGVISVQEISKDLGIKIVSPPFKNSKVLSPGQLVSHYAPRAELRLNALEAKIGETLIAFGRAAPSEGTIINLSPDGDLIEAAANLYSTLRGVDKMGFRSVAVMPIPETGIGIAINDRLRRAAAPR